MSACANLIKNKTTFILQIYLDVDPYQGSKIGFGTDVDWWKEL